MTGALTNHLWQSTVFAVAVGLVTLALRKNRAEIRYWLWLSASLKFLLPFSFLVSLGNRFEWALAAQKIATQAVSLTVVQITEPFPATISVVPSVPRATDWLLISLLGIWLCGFLVIVVQLFRGWLQIRAAVRSSTPLETGMAVEVRTCNGLLEPGVVGLDVAGLSRPIVLLPTGVFERLTQPQLEAVLAHELAHVRRRDNLTAALHMIVEAVFWFHPLVWRIGARLVEERERACDEEVMRLGNEPRVYAESILRVCEFYVESPLACVSGVTGADLKKRIHWIMKSHFGAALSTQKKLLLATAAVVALTLPIVAGALARTPDWQKAAGGKVSLDVAYEADRIEQRPSKPDALLASGANAPLAQEPSQSAAGTTPVAFEVVSIKPNHTANEPPKLDFTAGLMRARNLSVRALIEAAYKLDDVQLTRTGVPAWVSSEGFDIDAKIEDSVLAKIQKLPPDDRGAQRRQMLQSLLADRFKLEISHVTKELPIYELVVAKRGSKMKASPTAPVGDAARAVKFGPGQMVASGEPMSALAGALSVMPDVYGRVVVDKTGLPGVYDFTLKWTPQTSPSADAGQDSAPTDSASEPSLFTALREQLGLRLQPAKGPVDVLVIDHVEEPSPN